MNSKLEKLRAWGCDIDGTMPRLLNDEDFYIECLEEIPSEKYFTDLGEALKSHNISAAFDSAHTLKGIFANVGLVPMYEKTVEIVEPLREGRDENLSEKFDELMKMKNQLADIMKEQ